MIRIVAAGSRSTGVTVSSVRLYPGRDQYRTSEASNAGDKKTQYPPYVTTALIDFSDTAAAGSSATDSS